MVLLVLAGVLFVRIRRAQPPSTPDCGECHYAVPHDEAQICPECGSRYTVVGLRTPLYDPFAVWTTATTRGGLLVGAVIVLWIGTAIAFEVFAAKRTTFQSTSTLNIQARTDGLPYSAPGGMMWTVETTLEASGIASQPPDTMVLTLRETRSNRDAPILRFDASAKTVEVVQNNTVILSGSYVSKAALDECIANSGFPPDPALHAALAQYLNRMLNMAAGPTSALTSGASSTYDMSLPGTWFTTSSGSSSSYTGLSQSTSEAIMISGIVATFMAIALWLVHCRTLLARDKVRRKQLIQADGLA